MNSNNTFLNSKTMKCLTMYKLGIFLVTLCVLSNPRSIHAQGAFILTTDDDSCEVVQTFYAGDYPPNLVGMPWYIVNSYAAVDSVSRSVDIEVIQDSIRNLSDEILRLGYYHTLVATEYNPLLLHHYWWHGTYGEGENYVTKPRYTLAAMMEEFYDRFGLPDSNQHKILDADAGVYEVYIQNVSVRSDTGLFGYYVPNQQTVNRCAVAVIHNIHYGQITNFPYVSLDGIDYPTIQLNRVEIRSIPDEWEDDPYRYLTAGYRYLIFAEAFKLHISDKICVWRLEAPNMFLIDETGHLQDPLRFFGTTSVLSIDEARSIIQTWKLSLYSIGM